VKGANLMTETEPVREKNIIRLNELLKNFRTAMLTTLQTRDGSLHSRPMVVQQTPFNGRLWFFSKFSSAKVDEIRSGSQINLAYVDPEKKRYISVSGAAYILQDRLKMETLWDNSYRTWFPGGLEEPDLVLIRIDVTEAEIWDEEQQVSADRLIFTQ
jgi:general stress protein 26